MSECEALIRSMLKRNGNDRIKMAEFVSYMHFQRFIIHQTAETRVVQG